MTNTQKSESEESEQKHEADSALLATAVAALKRIRSSVGDATGLPDDSPLTYDQVAELVARICAATKAQVGISLLTRDL